MSEPLWAADIDVDAPLALRLVRARVPELHAQRAQPFGVGWDNAAFLIDDNIVFRFPRRRSVAALIKREIAILPRIAPLLPLAISAPRFIGAAGAEFPWIFAGYERVAGSTACSSELTEEARRALAVPLARFLRALHDIDPAPLVALGLPPDQIGRLDHDKRLRATRERLPTLAAAGVDDLEFFATWLATHPPAPLDDSRRRLVHGDLYARHVLLDENARPTGVIDWGDVHLGDPALDIAIAHLMLPASAHAAFRAAYGPLDDRTWTVARYRAIYHAVLELNYGIRQSDVAMRDIGITALRLMKDALTAH